MHVMNQIIKYKRIN